MNDFNEITGALLSLIEGSTRPSIFIDEFFRYLTTNQISLLEAYDIMGRISQHDPDLFMEKIFLKLYPRLDKYVTTKFGKNAIEKRYEMDEHILKNYCFFEDENLITSFKGYTKINKLSIIGYIYVTTHRIINVGVALKQQTISYKFLEAAIKSARAYSYRRTILEKIGDTQDQKSSDLNLGQWGYIIPVIGSRNILIKKDKIAYNHKMKEIIMTGIKAGERSKVYKIAITVSKVKGQTKQEFDDYSKERLDEIHQLLNKYV